MLKFAEKKQKLAFKNEKGGFMYNPYFYQQNYQQQQNYLPQQQIIQVNGKASVDTIQLAPNSSVLVMDTSAPIVWMCVSDGIGKVTSTPYDIVVHKEEPPVDMASVETRITRLEQIIAEMRSNNESNDDEFKQSNKNDVRKG